MAFGIGQTTDQPLAKNAIVSLLVLLLIILLVEYRSYRFEAAINQAVLTNSEFSGELTEESGPAASLLAWRAYQQGDFTTAETYYNLVLMDSDDGRVQNARFNLAELYLRKAVELEKSSRSDARVPYLELAKENYRKILRADNSHWPSRYNLSRVLQILPDAEIRVTQEDDVMPERSPSAPVETTAYERLP